ncbi:MAG: hypothetical protein VB144_03545 [Clostridia bacterium]|nr:hypothetical protein [Clostridia bacterium]
MRCASSRVILVIGVALIMSMCGVAVADDAPEIPIPTTDISRLGPEDLETNYYGLIVEWTQKASLADNVSVEVCYVDPKLALASAVVEGEVSEDNLREYTALLEESYAVQTPFRIRLSHGSDTQKLDISAWDLTVRNDKGAEFGLVDVSGGEPELRTSYSRGTYYQAEYNAAFSTSGEQFITSDTEWISVAFSKDGVNHELKWDFSSGVAAEESYVFENAVKSVTVGLLVLVCLALIVTRPRTEHKGDECRCTRD